MEVAQELMYAPDGGHDFWVRVVAGRWEVEVLSSPCWPFHLHSLPGSQIDMFSEILRARAGCVTMAANHCRHHSPCAVIWPEPSLF